MLSIMASKGSIAQALVIYLFIYLFIYVFSGPCFSYTALTDRWRRIVGYGPSKSLEPYHCDLPRYSQGIDGLREGWYRFMGEAGTHLVSML
jgi:hypothetical protein